VGCWCFNIATTSQLERTAPTPARKSAPDLPTRGRYDEKQNLRRGRQLDKILGPSSGFAPLPEQGPCTPQRNSESCDRSFGAGPSFRRLLCLSPRSAPTPRMTPVGSISDVEGAAEIVSSGRGRRRRRAHERRAQDGADGHLQVTFRDDTVLTLGEDERVVIDRYVFDPDQGVGDVLLTTTQGAFRFATGRLKDLSSKDITVATPVAEIGIRGTEFWGGPVDGEYSVLLLAGEIDVKNQAGTVRLNRPGLATVIRSRLQAPLRPSGLVGRQDRTRAYAHRDAQRAETARARTPELQSPRSSRRQGQAPGSAQAKTPGRTQTGRTQTGRAQTERPKTQDRPGRFTTASAQTSVAAPLVTPFYE
jgi:hypothetical protein